jgi:hypothetical protein
MTRSKAKQEAKVPATVAEQAEQQMRERLSVNPAPVDFKLGCPKPGAKMTPLWRRASQADCSLGQLVSSDPGINPRATLQEHYKHGQNFAIFNPCVSVKG